jgi:NADPH-dependent 2,4-dienoyl-CoA reductase/sulfur reductase-like enzyme/rhodanese-related sulfurtransferase
MKRILIVGGVAGGANAAARARRLCEKSEIIVFERGPYVSFANCGLPYHVGGEIPTESELLLHTPQSLKARFNLDVRVHSEVIAIDRSQKLITVRDTSTSRDYQERYDDLILATGGTPVKPPIPGITLPGIHTIRDVPDAVQIKAAVNSLVPKRAAVIGGGFIGLEMVEQLAHNGVHVTLIEGLPQVMPPLDEEMAAPLHDELRTQGVELVLGDPVASFQQTASGVAVETKSGRVFDVPLVILAIGVRPETTLAKNAGLTLGSSGGVQVNKQLQTSDPSIWAVGDCIEVTDLITGKPRIIPLAGPANRQGRLVADNIITGARKEYGGSLGTAILRLFNLTVASTGANERTLKREGLDYKALYLHPNSHAGYYPNAHPIALKVLFSPLSGRILGAQAVGRDGVDKRIDVLATAIKGALSIDEVAELELCYAPPFGSAKDPVNMVGMMAQNVRDGLVDVGEWSDLASIDNHVLLDVRQPTECAQGVIPHALNIPLTELRSRLAEIPRGKTVLVYCMSGQRSYYACRILQQHGIPCKNLSGAFKTWKMLPGTQPSC